MNVVLLMLKIVLKILNMLPQWLLQRFGYILGLLGFYLIGARRKVGIKNLNLCFPHMSMQEKRKIIKQHFIALVTNALEYGFVFYANSDKIRKLVELKNLDYVLEHYTMRPIILLCPHFVGLDLGVMRLSLEISGYSMYSRQRSSDLTELLKTARLRFIVDKGGKIFARQEGLRPIIKRLRQTKLAFYYLPDQDFGERDSMYVPFFAHPYCATVNVLPKLASLTDAIVIPMAVYKEKGNKHYTVEFSRAWDNYPSDDLRVDIIRMNRYVESAVVKHIEQYFWLHKRFKSQPNLPRGAIYKQGEQNEISGR